MILLDSSAWLEYFASGPLKDKFKEYLKNPRDIVTPTIVVYEVYKIIRQQFPEDVAMITSGHLQKTQLVPLNEKIALTAADFSIKYSLSMADAIIYATAFEHGCKIVTSDAHFEKLDNVIYIKK